MVFWPHFEKTNKQTKTVKEDKGLVTCPGLDMLPLCWIYTSHTVPMLSYDEWNNIIELVTSPWAFLKEWDTQHQAQLPVDDRYHLYLHFVSSFLPTWEFNFYSNCVSPQVRWLFTACNDFSFYLAFWSSTVMCLGVHVLIFILFRVHSASWIQAHLRYWGFSSRPLQ